MLRVKLKWISFEVRKFSGDLLTGLVLLIFFSAFIEQVYVKEVGLSWWC